MNFTRFWVGCVQFVRNEASLRVNCTHALNCAYNPYADAGLRRVLMLEPRHTWSVEANGCRWLLTADGLGSGRWRLAAVSEAAATAVSWQPRPREATMVADGDEDGRGYDAHEVEKAMLLDPAARLGADGTFA